MKKDLINNKGITIIALIITIIILIILSGIAILQLTGEKGLISKVNDTKKAQIKAEMEEKLRLIVSELQIEKEGKATIQDITEQYLKEKINEYEIEVTEDETINSKKIKMEKNKIIGTYIIDEKLNIIEIKNGENIQFFYEKGEKIGKKVNITIHIQDIENGIEKIQLPEKDAIIANGTKKEIGIDYEVELGKEYKIIITSTNGNIIEKIILIEPEIEITEPIIATTVTATSSVSDNSQTIGTELYINFSATLEGTECTIENKEDGLGVPYTIQCNGKYTFIISGIYDGKEINKEIEIEVNKYKYAKGLVKYDAGNWTEEEINELKNKKLYDLNSNHINNNIPKMESEDGWNFTFGGYTYKGSVDSKIQGVITSRNQSVKPQNGYGIPKYDGWQIFESESREVDGKERIYVTKIIHAGSPENFVYSNYDNGYDAYAASYILTGDIAYSNKGKTNFDNGTPIPIRDWSMYKDINQLELIDEVHGLRFEEGASGYGGSIINIRIPVSGGYFWVPGIETLETHRGRTLHAMRDGGNLNYSDSGYVFGIRPIVSFVEGVYICDGNGTATNPYILKKD